MQSVYDLGLNAWTLTGWTPNLWKMSESMETGESQKAEILPIPATVPGSVQGALLAAGMLPDWHIGFNARLCEWVENRHWAFQCQVELGADSDHHFELVLPGVDAEGWVRWDGAIIATFQGAHRPHRIALPQTAATGEHRLEIVFDSPMRFAGQFGRTPEMPVTKPRYYYTWDWIPRLVQIGITRAPYIRDLDAPQLRVTELWSDADAERNAGTLRLKGEVQGAETVQVALSRAGQVAWQRTLTAAEFQRGITVADIAVSLWYPNLLGEAVLYDLTVDAGAAGRSECRVGFKAVRWLPCAGAPVDADPWVCEVNGKAIFLQGINWTPIRAFYADLRREDYELRLRLYRDMGCNVVRVWGGAFLEPECFYELCDAYGLMVWQEFPMSSSGISNTPPDDAESIAEMRRIADYYLELLPRHVALLAWSGGNELQRGANGNVDGCGFPCDIDEPILGMLASVTALRDPRRRFMATSASGPREFGDATLYGQGLLWEVHGPWKCEGTLAENWNNHWDADDALFRAEFGCPGASSAALIRHYAGGEQVYPCSPDIPLWRYPLAWWSEQPTFEAEMGRIPRDLEEYVQWSQTRQQQALGYAVRAMKGRFPACGGAILWMGHDAFPCPSNTSLIDFDGNMKPAAAELRRIFRNG